MACCCSLIPLRGPDSAGTAAALHLPQLARPVRNDGICRGLLRRLQGLRLLGGDIAGGQTVRRPGGGARVVAHTSWSDRMTHGSAAAAGLLGGTGRNGKGAVRRSGFLAGCFGVLSVHIDVEERLRSLVALSVHRSRCWATPKRRRKLGCVGERMRRLWQLLEAGQDRAWSVLQRLVAHLWSVDAHEIAIAEVLVAIKSELLLVRHGVQEACRTSPWRRNHVEAVRELSLRRINLAELERSVS